MYQIVLASCLLAVLAAAPADDKKAFPGWPSEFSMTQVITHPFGRATLVARTWYDGEEGNVKMEVASRATDGKMTPKLTGYAWKKYEGRGAVVRVNNTKGTCIVKYERAILEQATKNPLPSLENAQFLGESEVDGVKTELWQIKQETPGERDVYIRVYLRQQESLAVPVKLEVYEANPQISSGVQLIGVAQVEEFSASKPSASVFEFDASKCEESSNLRFLSGMHRQSKMEYTGESIGDGFPWRSLNLPFKLLQNNRA